MAESGGHLIREEGGPSHFAMIPKIVNEADIPHSAIRLYVHFKLVCGEGGECYQSLETIAKACRMKTTTVTKARRILEEAGFIRTTREARCDGAPILTITVRNVWNKNRERAKTQAERAKTPDRGLTPPKGYSAETPDGAPKNNPKKKTSRNTSYSEKRARRSGEARPTSGFDLDVTDKDLRYAKKVVTTLRKAGSDLTVRRKTKAGSPRAPVSPKTIAKTIAQIRTERRIPTDEIRDVLKWYCLHYREEYTPKMRHATDLFDKWGQIAEAKERYNGSSNRKGRAEEKKLAQDKLEAKLRGIWYGKLGNKLGNRPMPSWIDAKLEELGYKPGTVLRGAF